MHFRIDENLSNEFKEICEKLNTNISEEIREMIKNFVRKNRKKGDNNNE